MYVKGASPFDSEDYQIYITILSGLEADKIVKQDSHVQSFNQPDSKNKFNNRGQNTIPV